MIKLVSILQRRNGMDVEAFQAHWRDVHAGVVSRLPGLRRYVQCHTLLSGYKKLQPAADGVAELWFDSTDALRALNGSSALDAVRADEARFIDTERHVQLFVDEHVIKDGAVPTSGVKNIEFVHRKAGMDVPEFQRYWREVHGPLGASIPTIDRYVQNHARATSYLNGRTPALDGFALTWFESTQAMRGSVGTDAYAATRDDEANFVRGHLDFIITREHVILPGP